MNIILENELCRLILGEDAQVKSLVLKTSGEECLVADREVSFFSVTQERPFNNEIKLIYPNKRTTYQANRLRREGDALIVGFELIPYEAVIRVTEAPMYIAFSLERFIVDVDTYYEGMCMDLPPVEELRLIQLPVRDRENFGQWLNVMWDKNCAVNVLATSVHAGIDAEKRKGFHILTADARKNVLLEGCGAALICAPMDRYLDAVASLEEDFDMPRGVESRRNKSALNASMFWVGYNLQPKTVDEQIALAKKAGIRMMLIYYTAFFRNSGGYAELGNYEFNERYPNGLEDVRYVLQRLRQAGITPGLHVLPTHIGLKSRYVTPVADPRLHLTHRYTLSRPLPDTDEVCDIYVEENPSYAPKFDVRRVLQFDGELISYEGCTTERPYRFTGCKRGAHNTAITAHCAGCHGGILDVSEYAGQSCYVDQDTSLQSEIMDKIAAVYNCGMQFIYFDGAEGTHAPFDYYIANVQYQLYQRAIEKPLFMESAAKTHFGWHLLGGGNAFDYFAPEIFKECIDRFPAEEASLLQKDFTRVNFGWWQLLTPGTQPDMYEYGTSKAAAWDCPTTIMNSNPDTLHTHPRTGDFMEILRRWEDVRQKQWLTQEQKELLRQSGKEYILLVNEAGEYELLPYTQIPCQDDNLRAFVFSRREQRYVVFWHASGNGTVRLPLAAEHIVIERTLGGEQIPVTPTQSDSLFPAGDRCYLHTALSEVEIVSAFTKATIE